jgi:hypothetical protein
MTGHFLKLKNSTGLAGRLHEKFHHCDARPKEPAWAGTPEERFKSGVDRPMHCYKSLRLAKNQNMGASIHIVHMTEY